MGRHQRCYNQHTRNLTQGFSERPTFRTLGYTLLMGLVAAMGCDADSEDSSSDGGVNQRSQLATIPISFGTRLLLPGAYLTFDKRKLYGWEICTTTPDDEILRHFATCMRTDAVAPEALIEGTEDPCVPVNSENGGGWAYDDFRPLRADEVVRYVTVPIWGLDLTRARDSASQRSGPCQTDDDPHLQHTFEPLLSSVFRTLHVRSDDDLIVGSDPVMDESVVLDFNPREEEAQYVALRILEELEEDAEPIVRTERWRHSEWQWREPPLEGRPDLPRTRGSQGDVWALYAVSQGDTTVHPSLHLADGAYRIEARAARWLGAEGDGPEGEVAPEDIVVSARYEELRFEMDSTLCDREGDALRAERLEFEVELPSTWRTPWAELRWRDPRALGFLCLGDAVDTLALSISREIIVAGHAGAPTQIVDPTAELPDPLTDEITLQDKDLDFTHGHSVRYTAVLSYLDADETRQELTLPPVETPLPILFPELRGFIEPIPGAAPCQRDSENDNEHICQGAPQVTVSWRLPDTGPGVGPTLPPGGVWLLSEDLSVAQCTDMAIEHACAGRPGCSDGPESPPDWQPEALGDPGELARAEAAFRHDVALSQGHALCLGMAPYVDVEMSPTTLRAATSSMVIRFLSSEFITNDDSDPLKAFLKTPDACGSMHPIADGDQVASRRVVAHFSTDPWVPPTEVMVAYGPEDSGCTPEHLLGIVSEMCADPEMNSEIPAPCGEVAEFFPGGDERPARYPLTALSEHHPRLRDAELFFVGSVPPKLWISTFFCQKYPGAMANPEEEAPPLIHIRRHEVRNLDVTFDLPSDREEIRYAVHEGAQPGNDEPFVDPRHQPAVKVEAHRNITFEANLDGCDGQWTPAKVELRFFRIPTDAEAFEADVRLDFRLVAEMARGLGLSDEIVESLELTQNRIRQPQQNTLAPNQRLTIPVPSEDGVLFVRRWLDHAPGTWRPLLVCQTGDLHLPSEAVSVSPTPIREVYGEAIRASFQVAETGRPWLCDAVSAAASAGAINVDVERSLPYEVSLRRSEPLPEENPSMGPKWSMLDAEGEESGRSALGCACLLVDQAADGAEESIPCQMGQDGQLWHTALEGRNISATHRLWQCDSVHDLPAYGMLFPEESGGFANGQIHELVFEIATASPDPEAQRPIHTQRFRALRFQPWVDLLHRGGYRPLSPDHIEGIEAVAGIGAVHIGRPSDVDQPSAFDFAFLTGEDPALGVDVVRNGERRWFVHVPRDEAPAMAQYCVRLGALFTSTPPRDPQDPPERDLVGMCREMLGAEGAAALAANPDTEAREGFCLLSKPVCFELTAEPPLYFERETALLRGGRDQSLDIAVPEPNPSWVVDASGPIQWRVDVCELPGCPPWPATPSTLQSLLELNAAQFGQHPFSFDNDRFPWPGIGPESWAQAARRVVELRWWPITLFVAPEDTPAWLIALWSDRAMPARPIVQRRHYLIPPTPEIVCDASPVGSLRGTCSVENIDCPDGLDAQIQVQVEPDNPAVSLIPHRAPESLEFDYVSQGVHDITLTINCGGATAEARGSCTPRLPIFDVRFSPTEIRDRNPPACDSGHPFEVMATIEFFDPRDGRSCVGHPDFALADAVQVDFSLEGLGRITSERIEEDSPCRRRYRLTIENAGPQPRVRVDVVLGSFGVRWADESAAVTSYATKSVTLWPSSGNNISLDGFWDPGQFASLNLQCPRELWAHLQANVRFCENEDCALGRRLRFCAEPPCQNNGREEIWVACGEMLPHIIWQAEDLRPPVDYENRSVRIHVTADVGEFDENHDGNPPVWTSCAHQRFTDIELTQPSLALKAVQWTGGHCLSGLHLMVDPIQAWGNESPAVSFADGECQYWLSGANRVREPIGDIHDSTCRLGEALEVSWPRIRGREELTATLEWRFPPETPFWERFASAQVLFDEAATQPSLTADWRDATPGGQPDGERCLRSLVAVVGPGAEAVAVLEEVRRNEAGDPNQAPPTALCGGDAQHLCTEIDLSALELSQPDVDLRAHVSLYTRSGRGLPSGELQQQEAVSEVCHRWTAPMEALPLCPAQTCGLDVEAASENLAASCTLPPQRLLSPRLPDGQSLGCQYATRLIEPEAPCSIHDVENLHIRSFNPPAAQDSLCEQPMQRIERPRVCVYGRDRFGRLTVDTIHVDPPPSLMLHVEGAAPARRIMADLEFVETPDRTLTIQLWTAHAEDAPFERQVYPGVCDSFPCRIDVTSMRIEANPAPMLRARLVQYDRSDDLVTLSEIASLRFGEPPPGDNAPLAAHIDPITIRVDPSRDCVDGLRIRPDLTQGFEALWLTEHGNHGECRVDFLGDDDISVLSRRGQCDHPNQFTAPWIALAGLNRVTVRLRWKPSIDSPNSHYSPPASRVLTLSRPPAPQSPAFPPPTVVVDGLVGPPNQLCLPDPGGGIAGLSLDLHDMDPQTGLSLSCDDQAEPGPDCDPADAPRRCEGSLPLAAVAPHCDAGESIRMTSWVSISNAHDDLGQDPVTCRTTQPTDTGQTLPDEACPRAHGECPAPPNPGIGGLCSDEITAFGRGDWVDGIRICTTCCRAQPARSACPNEPDWPDRSSDQQGSCPDGYALCASLNTWGEDESQMACVAQRDRYDRTRILDPLPLRHLGAPPPSLELRWSVEPADHAPLNDPLADRPMLAATVHSVQPGVCTFDDNCNSPEAIIPCGPDTPDIYTVAHHSDEAEPSERVRPDRRSYRAMACRPCGREPVVAPSVDIIAPSLWTVSPWPAPNGEAWGGRALALARTNACLLVHRFETQGLSMCAGESEWRGDGVTTSLIQEESLLADGAIRVAWRSGGVDSQAPILQRWADDEAGWVSTRTVEGHATYTLGRYEKLLYVRAESRPDRVQVLLGRSNGVRHVRCEPRAIDDAWQCWSAHTFVLDQAVGPVEAAALVRLDPEGAQSLLTLAGGELWSGEVVDNGALSHLERAPLVADLPGEAKGHRQLVALDADVASGRPALLVLLLDDGVPHRLMWNQAQAAWDGIVSSPSGHPDLAAGCPSPLMGLTLRRRIDGAPTVLASSVHGICRLEDLLAHTWILHHAFGELSIGKIRETHAFINDSAPEPSGIIVADGAGVIALASEAPNGPDLQPVGSGLGGLKVDAVAADGAAVWMWTALLTLQTCTVAQDGDVRCTPRGPSMADLTDPAWRHRLVSAPAPDDRVRALAVANGEAMLVTGAGPIGLTVLEPLIWRIDFADAWRSTHTPTLLQPVAGRTHNGRWWIVDGPAAWSWSDGEARWTPVALPGPINAQDRLLILPSTRPNYRLTVAHLHSSQGLIDPHTLSVYDVAADGRAWPRPWHETDQPRVRAIHALHQPQGDRILVLSDQGEILNLDPNTGLYASPLPFDARAQAHADSDIAMSWWNGEGEGESPGRIYWRLVPAEDPFDDRVHVVGYVAWGLDVEGVVFVEGALTETPTPRSRLLTTANDNVHSVWTYDGDTVRVVTFRPRWISAPPR